MFRFSPGRYCFAVHFLPILHSMFSIVLARSVTIPFPIGDTPNPIPTYARCGDVWPIDFNPRSSSLFRGQWLNSRFAPLVCTPWVVPLFPPPVLFRFDHQFPEKRTVASSPGCHSLPVDLRSSLSAIEFTCLHQPPPVHCR